MATGSQSYTGRFDEQLAELREVVSAVQTDNDRSRIRRIALSALESLEGTAKPNDTVHVSVNVGTDGSGGVTYTITVTHTPTRERSAG